MQPPQITALPRTAPVTRKQNAKQAPLKLPEPVEARHSAVSVTAPPITPPALSRPLPRARFDPPPMATAMGAMAATCMASIPAAATFPGDLGVGRRRAVVPGWRAGGRRLRATPPARRPFLFSPKGVSDSRSSQTCLDPDASTVRDKKRAIFWAF